MITKDFRSEINVHLSCSDELYPFEPNAVHER